jgi:hypothetical protein
MRVIPRITTALVSAAIATPVPVTERGDGAAVDSCVLLRGRPTPASSSTENRETPRRGPFTGGLSRRNQDIPKFVPDEQRDNARVDRDGRRTR